MALVLPSHVVSLLKKGLLVWLEMDGLSGTNRQITSALGEKGRATPVALMGLLEV